jgi:hypothetical protein
MTANRVRDPNSDPDDIVARNAKGSRTTPPGAISGYGVFLFERALSQTAATSRWRSRQKIFRNFLFQAGSIADQFTPSRRDVSLNRAREAAR